MGGSAAIFAAPDPRSGLADGLVSPCMGALPEQLTQVDLPAAKSLTPRSMEKFLRSSRGDNVVATVRWHVVTALMIPPLSHPTPAKAVARDAALQQNCPQEQRSVTTAPPVDLLVSKSLRGQRRQEEIRLAASRLAYDDLPTFPLLQSVSSRLVETGDPMAYW